MGVVQTASVRSLTDDDLGSLSSAMSGREFHRVPHPRARETLRAEPRVDAGEAGSVSRSPLGSASFVTLAVALAALGFLAALFQICNNDVWWHIRTGELILDTGRIPKADPFSHLVQGQPWVTHSWGSEVLIGLAARAGGPEGVTLAKCAVIAILAALLGGLARRAGASAGATFVAVVLVLGMIRFRLFERPHLVTLLLLPVLIEEIVRAVRGKSPRPWRRDLIPVALFLVWANLHVGFLLGLGLVALATVGAALRSRFRAARRLLAVFGLSFVATLINPHGYLVHLYAFQNERVLEAVRNLEWLPPTFAQFPMFFSLVALLVLLALAHRRRAEMRWLLLLPLGVLAFRSNRAIGEFGVVAAVPLALLLTHTAKGAQKRMKKRLGKLSPAIGSAVVVLATLTVGALHAGGVVIPASTYRFGFGAHPDLFPVAAAEVVEAHDLVGNLANTPAFGGYLIWRFETGRPVMFDGRIVLYREVIEALGSTPWQQTIDRLGLTYAVLRTQAGPAPEPLLAAVSSSEDWALLHWDDVATVWARRTPEHAAAIRAAEYHVVSPQRDPARVPPDSLAAAVEEYERAARTEPSFGALFGLGVTRVRAGNAAGAVEALQHATALRPDDPRGWMMVAYAQLGAGRPGDALPAARQAVKLAPRDPLALRHLGVAFFDLQRYADALEPLERAASLAPRNPEIKAYLAECRKRARGSGGQ